jgi:CheY-like chemotaxis protein
METETTKQGVVLIVDDDEAIRETLQLVLEMERYPTAVASDGRDALAGLRAHPSPRLILLDLMMPTMDGWEVLGELRRDDRLARVPVVVITAFCRDLGAAAELPILRKPVELGELLGAIERHGGGPA